MVFIADAYAGSINFTSPATLNASANATIATSGNNLLFQTLLNQPITSGNQPVNVPITSSRLVTAATLGKLAQRVVAGSIQGMVVQAALTAALQQAGYTCTLDGCRQVPLVQVGNEYPSTLHWISYATPLLACRAVYPNTVSYPNLYITNVNAVQVWCWNQPASGSPTQLLNISAAPKCAPGDYVKSGTYAPNAICIGAPCPTGQARDSVSNACTVAAAAGTPVSDPTFANNVFPTISRTIAGQMLQQAVNAGDPVPADPAIISGPASVTSSPQVTTTTNSVTNQTTVTTNTTTVNNTYAGSTLNYTVSNNSQTTINGVPTQTTTEGVNTEDPPPESETPPDEQVTVNDTAMPDVPILYERKYPDGIAGVWSARIAEMKATPVFSLSAIFAPTVGAGSCPTWTFNANIGPMMNFGQGVISPPCWLWTALKAVLIITALMICRRIIFGG